ncbi:hypothetical protein NQD34_004843 [Periophthalmus magnuspinnatus]|nr:hypothetical protein NQD34_004843 [Periophthalmus magnuspinnatus]
MSQIHRKLKLKRKKSCANPELPYPEKQRGVRPRSEREDAQAAGPVLPSAPGPACVSAPAPGPAPASALGSLCSGVDRLWVLSLSWILQELHDPSGQVPELPPPSAATPLPRPSPAHWGLTDEIPPFPEPSSSVQSCPESDAPMDCLDSQDIFLSPDTAAVAPLIQQRDTCAPKALLPQSQRGRDAPGTSGRTEETGTTDGTGMMEGPWRRTGRLGVTERTGRIEEAQGGARGTNKRGEMKGTWITGETGRTEGIKGTGETGRTEMLYTDGTGGKGRIESTGGTEGTRRTSQLGGTEMLCTEETGRIGRLGGAGGTGGTEGAEELLASCPMCLMVFSLGLSQLDRDSHLAQCLSDVNIDVTW